MQRTTFIRIAAAVTVVAAGAGLVGSRPAEAADQEPGDVTVSAINCRKTFTTGGTGANRFTWCFSDTGNIVQLTGPGTVEHIRVGTFLEGYAVCIGAATEGFDNGNSGAGFGGPSYPNVTTVVRNTPNTRLTQEFTQIATDKIAKVTMTLANITGAPLTNVRVSRFVDLDLDNSPAGDRWDKSTSSLWAAETAGITMAGRSTRIGATTATIVESFGDLLNDTGCDATTPLVTPFSGDASGRITYSVGTINPGKSATMTFSYTLG